MADIEQNVESEGDNSSSEDDMENPEATSGCVRVVNDVMFDFDIDIGESYESFVLKRELEKYQFQSAVIAQVSRLKKNVNFF